MSILKFQRPDKVTMLHSTSTEGKFEFKPLEQGYGLTVGNALRRVLLSSLEGHAITSVKFDNIYHEFTTMPGVVEDVTEIILNLKQVRFKKLIDDVDNERITVNIANQKQFKAADLQKFTSNFQILNTDLVLCNLEQSIELNMELTIDRGRGYVFSDENKKENAPLGEIAIDAVFTPIKNVKYHVEDCRVEKKTDYEKLTIEVETDGSIMPKEALTEAAKTIIYHFQLFSGEQITAQDKTPVVKETQYQELIQTRRVLKTKLSDLQLSVRAVNCLKTAEVSTLGELVSYSKSDLLRFRNFGKKTLTELEELVVLKGLNFGMDVTKYKLHLD